MIRFGELTEFLESGRELPLKQLGNLTADWKREIALEKICEAG